MTYPQLATVDCAICGEPVTIAIEGTRTAAGTIIRPTVLAGCEHFHPKEEQHEA